MKKIMIATPVRGECAADFTSSLTSTIFLLKSKGIDTAWAPAGGGDAVHTKRNKLTQLFRNSTQFDEILWWDSDTGVEPDDVLRLVCHDRDIVAGVSPYRESDNQGFPIVVTKDRPPDEAGLIETDLIGAAMLKIKREVFDRLEQLGMAPLRVQYKKNTWDEAVRWRSFFDWEVDEERHLEYSEDFTFCRKCRRAGYKIWLEPRMTIRHHGLSHRSGNYHEQVK